MKNRIFSLCLVLCLCLSLCSCRGEQTYRYTVTGTFDTIIEILSSSAEATEHYGKTAEKQLKIWHELCDAYHPYADVVGIYAINQSGGKWVTVSDELLGLLTFGQQAYAKTEGAVNMMCGAVSRLWKDTETPPTEAEIRAALSHTDIGCLEIDGNRVRLTDPDAYLDMGAFAKGYALERVARQLEADGFGGLISAVSSVIAVGDKNGQPFAVGIGDQQGGVGAVLQLKNMALSTSGTDQRYFIYEEKTYHHILDLTTGFPAESGVTQASVLHENAAWADVYSTAALIRGRAEGDAILRRNGTYEYYGKIKEWL
ncbi:MAG: FAD:protein FMN transferase [Clostridia bacterium]|nr:FAD:protein FMN transferase [Clostridia bacterium]